ncbi:hypothetical protein [Marinomonas pollencensis]|uniref:Uncharacterized protein n=1 Tax=Marinomonas pollencensis TaxID=491954 RepID=A0A3E0DTH5_9GAMM|nr:hypothetical protein [Marinomonas pollencensis]REG85806.1 hypothetical protein DFP81_102345 [Marinomonas pollencensis]
MTALIVVFITLSLMGSALWIVPPKQERRRMALRMLARKHGLTVQLTSIELPDKWDKSKEKHKSCGYGFYRAKPVQEMTEKTLLLKHEIWKYQVITTGWWANAALLLSEQDQKDLAILHDSVTAIEITRDAVIAYWHEGGAEVEVEVMGRLLPSLAKCSSK